MNHDIETNASRFGISTPDDGPAKGVAPDEAAPGLQAPGLQAPELQAPELQASGLQAPQGHEFDERGQRASLFGGGLDAAGSGHDPQDAEASHLACAGMAESVACRPETAAVEASLRLAEALVFASTAPVSRRALAAALPEGADVSLVIARLIERYVGRGVELAEIGAGVQFRTAADLAPLLRKVIAVPRRLPRVAMETLAIIAYHQPVTRSEVEELRGVSLSQQTLDALVEMDLITIKGQRETPGRPSLWGTTARFLAQFGLKDLRDMPRREDLLVDLPMKSDGPVSPAPGSC